MMGFDEPPKGVEDSATLCNCFLPDVKLSFWVQTQSAFEIMGGKACWGSGGGEEGRKTKRSRVCVCVCVCAYALDLMMFIPRTEQTPAD